MHNIYRSKGCINMFCSSLRKHARKIINFKKKEIKLLKKEQRNHIKIQKSVMFVKKKLKIDI